MEMDSSAHGTSGSGAVTIKAASDLVARRT